MVYTWNDGSNMNEKILQIITIVSQALVVIIWFFSSFLNEKKNVLN